MGLLALLSLAAASFAGCGGDAQGSGGGGREALRIASAEPVGVLDPHDYTGGFIPLDMIYEPLVRYGERGRIEPHLAESWEVADDRLSVRFELRRGVTFHDGSPFDAEAVKWNFDRWVGEDEHSFLRAAEVIRETRVVDEHTVELRLSRPYAPLLAELSLVRPMRFLSPSSVGRDGKFGRPVGTGPWRFGGGSETDAAMTRYGDYWGETPSLRRVEFRVIPDSRTRVAALRSGEVDLIGGAYLSPISPLEAREIGAGGEPRLSVGEPDSTLALGFNTDGPLGEQALRRAVARSIDREEINDALYAGYGETAGSLFPPSIPDAGGPWDLAHDPSSAKALLDEAGWTRDGGGVRTRDGGPLELTLLVPSEPVAGVQDMRTTSEAVAAELEKVGIGVRIEAVDGAAYLEERTAGNYDLAFFPTYGAPYDPSGSLVAYFGQVDADTTFFFSRELKASVDEALFARGGDEREDGYRAVYDLLEREAAVVPLTYRPSLWAVGPAVEGFRAPATNYHVDLTDVSVSR